MTEGRRRRLTCGFRTTTKKRTAARNIWFSRHAEDPFWYSWARSREPVSEVGILERGRRELVTTGRYAWRLKVPAALEYGSGCAAPSPGSPDRRR